MRSSKFRDIQQLTGAFIIISFMFSARLRLFMYTPGSSFNNIPTEFMTLALFHLQHTTLKGNRRRVLILQDRFMPWIFHRPTLPPTVSMVIHVAIGCRRTWIAKIDPLMFGTMSILVYIVFVLAWYQIGKLPKDKDTITLDDVYIETTGLTQHARHC